MMTARIAEEQRVVEAMVRLYCRHHRSRRHGAPLCDGCHALLEYAQHRLGRCRFGEEKPTCRQCPVHCYRKDMAARMRVVMRWAGPRMMLRHPFMAVRHLLRETVCKKTEYNGQGTEIQQQGRARQEEA